MYVYKKIPTTSQHLTDSHPPPPLAPSPGWAGQQTALPADLGQTAGGQPGVVLSGLDFRRVVNKGAIYYQ